VTGRAACDRRTIQVHDLAAEESEYPVGSSNAKREGHPHHAGDAAVARRLSDWNNSGAPQEVRPFSDEEVALIETSPTRR